MSISEIKIRRMPDDLKQWLATRAEENFTSINIEILQLLKAAKQADKGQPKAA